MQNYDDLLIRDNFNDNGSTPSSDILSASPDIIPFGTIPVSDPSGFFSANYSSDPGQNLVAYNQNYIYMRVKNLAAGGSWGTLSLYYAKSSLLLFPSLWQRNVLFTNSGSKTARIRAANSGNIAVTDEPFLWLPQAIPKSQYSLIGVVSTLGNPNPIYNITDIDAFATYLTNNKGTAVRNVILKEGDDDFTQSVQYDQGSLEGYVCFAISCKNIPVGASVAFESDSPNADPLINLPKATVTNSHDFTVGVIKKIPADFSSNFTYSYLSNGNSPLEGWSISLSAIYLVQETNTLYGQGKSMHELGEIISEHSDLLPNSNSYRGIKVGNHTVKSDQR